MLLGGLWHGANWTFVVWGAVHGSYLMAERGLRARFADYRPGPWAIFGIGLMTYILINVTWVFFRAKNFTIAWQVLGGMAGANAHAKPILATVFLAAVAFITPAMLAAHWYMRDRTLESVVARVPPIVISLLWGLMIFAIVISQGSGNAFIYFQF
jgi:alginate O-acetyltransferase complex protein AlgI